VIGALRADCVELVVLESVVTVFGRAFVVALPALQHLDEGVEDANEGVTIAVVVEADLYLERAVTKLVQEELLPLRFQLQTFRVEQDVRDWVLGHLEDDSVDQRVNQKVVPAPPEHLLDGGWQVGLCDVEERARVLKTGVCPTSTTSRCGET